MIKGILACDEEGGIGKDNGLPWPKNSRDLKWFKDNTVNHIVVMGSSTWNSKGMPKPLPDRVNVVATYQDEKLFDCDGILKGDLGLAVLRLQDMYLDKDVWIIGGPNVVAQTLGVIEEFYLTRIPGKYECDKFLTLGAIEQNFDKTWEEVHEEATFEIWRKRETVS